jgi:hypothetical protein
MFMFFLNFKTLFCICVCKCVLKCVCEPGGRAGGGWNPLLGEIEGLLLLWVAFKLG